MTKFVEMPQQQKIAIGILAVVALIMFYTKVYVPLQKKINDTQQTLEKKQAELEDMKRKARQLDKLEKEYKMLEEQLKSTEKKLPTTAELPQFIKLITETATKHGMDVDNLKVLPPKSDQYYMTHAYSLTLKSDYNTFGQFFTEVVQLDRIFNIIDVALTPSNVSGGKEELMGSFSIVAYTSK